ncbi:hypothetical protein CRYPD_51 [uncultured Candidatus Thioglobus sp.]|nr:hypothetical protein CRYPD_51 [uncultured Candidatus Thioglobus sp.]
MLCYCDEVVWNHDVNDVPVGVNRIMASYDEPVVVNCGVLC